MLLSLRENGLTSLFKEVRGFQGNATRPKSQSLQERVFQQGACLTIQELCAVLLALEDCKSIPAISLGKAGQSRV